MKCQRGLFVLHLPPPVHGSSIVGQQIKDSKIIHEGWKARFINLNTSPSADAIGKVGVKKICAYATILLRVAGTLIGYRPTFAYIAITVSRGGFFKDLGVVGLIKLFRVPVIYHLHNKGVVAHQNKWPYRWLYPWVFRNSQVILLSKNLFADVARFVPRNQVAYCPNGICDKAPDGTSKIKAKRQPVILFLSNLIESKGAYVLLAACALLKERGLDFCARFVGGEGDIDTHSFLKRVSALGLADRAVYLGRKFGEDKDAMFEEADIFAFPTYYHKECLPLVVIEAMMWRLPVVTTPEGGIQDLVSDGENGLLVPQRSAERLADALETLLSDSKMRHRMGKAARSRYEERFTEQSFEENLSRILERFQNEN